MTPFTSVPWQYKWKWLHKVFEPPYYNVLYEGTVCFRQVSLEESKLMCKVGNFAFNYGYDKAFEVKVDE